MLSSLEGLVSTVMCLLFHLWCVLTQNIDLDSTGTPGGVPDIYKGHNEIASGSVHLVLWVGSAVKTRKSTESPRKVSNPSERLAATSVMSRQNRMALAPILAERCLSNIQ